MIVWLSLTAVRIHASNVAACVETDAAQFPGTLPHPLVVRKLSTAPAAAKPSGFVSDGAEADVRGVTGVVMSVSFSGQNDDGMNDAASSGIGVVTGLGRAGRRSGFGLAASSEVSFCSTRLCGVVGSTIGRAGSPRP